MTMPRTDFEVVTAAGATIKTFEDRQAAIAHAEEKAADFPGLTVKKVQYLAPLRLTIWTEAKLQLVRSAGR